MYQELKDVRAELTGPDGMFAITETEIRGKC